MSSLPPGSPFTGRGCVEGLERCSSLYRFINFED